MSTTLVEDTAAKAEAHFNAYRTALERRDFATALKELMSAVKLDAKRFAPFPVGKYQPQTILGAGGFGVAFSCRHKELKADVVIKTLTSDDLAREVDEVFNEARVLDQLDHPGIIRLRDCGYTIPAEKSRPYFVMNFFAGATLEEHVKKHGALSPADLIAVARQMAEGLQAAARQKDSAPRRETSECAGSPKGVEQARLQQCLDAIEAPCSRRGKPVACRASTRPSKQERQGPGDH